jgi:Zn-dependent protease
MLIALLFSDPIVFAIIAIGILGAITIHEFAHAFVADKLGDPTPRYQDRVTLDPRAHLDPIGTIAIFLVGFGWGKPVSFDPYNLKEPQRDTALIALAGPASNIIIAITLAVVFHLGLLGFLSAALPIIIQINIMLAIFNLIPVHPLDGSKILMAFLPSESAYEYEKFMNKYGMFVLIMLIMRWNGVSPVSQLITPVIQMIMSLLGV